MSTSAAPGPTHQPKSALSTDEKGDAHVPPASSRGVWMTVLVVAALLGIGIALALHRRAANEAALAREGEGIGDHFGQCRPSERGDLVR